MKGKGKRIEPAWLGDGVSRGERNLPLIVSKRESLVQVSKGGTRLWSVQRGAPGLGGSSTRREKLEIAFEQLLLTIQPADALHRIASAMFAELWNRRLAQAEEHAKALKMQAIKIERQIAQLLERIVDTTVPSVIGAYESQIARLEQDKQVVRDHIVAAGRPANTFENTLTTAMPLKPLEYLEFRAFRGT